MKLIRFNPRKVDEIADSVAAALKRGAVVAPLLGGYCVLSLDPDWLSKRFGKGFRIVAGPDLPKDELTQVDEEHRPKVAKVMNGPVAAVLERHGEWRGAAFATEPLAQAILTRSADTIGLGVPDEVSSVDELAAELREEFVLRVVREGETGPGPTVVDFTGRPVVVDRKGKLAILDLEQQLGEMVRLGPLVVFSVLVVCTGNCCRSPMASGLLSKLLEGERVFVFSAGTDAPEGAPATRFALETAAELGADLSSHRAQQFVPAMVRNADLVLVMEEYHRTRVVEMVPDAAGRTKLLRDYPDGTDEIADPIGRSPEFYRETAAQMKPGLERAAEDVRQRLEVND